MSKYLTMAQLDAHIQETVAADADLPFFDQLAQHDQCVEALFSSTNSGFAHEVYAARCAAFAARGVWFGAMDKRPTEDAKQNAAKQLTAEFLARVWPHESVEFIAGAFRAYAAAGYVKLDAPVYGYVNGRAVEASSPLAFAVRERNVQLFRLLLECGSWPGARMVVARELTNSCSDSQTTIRDVHGSLLEGLAPKLGEVESEMFELACRALQAHARGDDSYGLRFRAGTGLASPSRGPVALDALPVETLLARDQAMSLEAQARQHQSSLLVLLSTCVTEDLATAEAARCNAFLSRGVPVGDRTSAVAPNQLAAELITRGWPAASRHLVAELFKGYCAAGMAVANGAMPRTAGTVEYPSYLLYVVRELMPAKFRALLEAGAEVVDVPAGWNSGSQACTIDEHLQLVRREPAAVGEMLATLREVAMQRTLSTSMARSSLETKSPSAGRRSAL